MFEDLMNITAGQPQLTEEELQRLLQESLASSLAPQQQDGDRLMGRRVDGVNISDGFNSGGAPIYAAPTSSMMPQAQAPAFPFMTERPSPARVLGYNGSRGWTDDSEGHAWDARAAQNMGIFKINSDRAMQQQAMQNQNRMFDARLMSDNNLAALRTRDDSARLQQQDRQFDQRLELDRQRIEMDNQLRSDMNRERHESNTSRQLADPRLPPSAKMKIIDQLPGDEETKRLQRLDTLTQQLGPDGKTLSPIGVKTAKGVSFADLLSRIPEGTSPEDTFKLLEMRGVTRNDAAARINELLQESMGWLGSTNPENLSQEKKREYDLLLTKLKPQMTTRYDPLARPRNR